MTTQLSPIRLLLSMSIVSLGIVLTVASCDEDPKEPQVVTGDDGIYINEIHSAGPDWIELYNANDDARDIGGYFIYDDATKKYKLPNASIAGKGFLVIFCDDSGVGLNTNFKLSSSGETVYLQNPSGSLIDKVTFPALNEGQTYGRYPDGTATLKTSGNATQGASNGETQAPVIIQVTRTPLVPRLDQSVTVQAEFASTEGVTEAKLYYRLNSGAFTSSDMTKDGNFYNGVIPAMTTVGKVEYYVQAKNAGGKTTVHPGNAPAKTDNFLLNTDALPLLRVNEFMSNNTSCCADNDSGTAEFDDWIEIYNAGDTPVNIGGMYLSDDVTKPFNAKIPADNPSVTTIPAKGFLVIWADGSVEQGPLHVDFSLASAGAEDVAIFYLDGRLIDAKENYAAQSENKSTARSVDGAGVWKDNVSPTQGSTNE